MRIMGLDYGSKTVGVAISDALCLTAQGIETIERKEENKLRRTCARIEELVREYGVGRIVLGFPKHMNNDVGERALNAAKRNPAVWVGVRRDANRPMGVWARARRRVRCGRGRVARFGRGWRHGQGDDWHGEDSVYF